jgi:hypothetical protein
MEIQQSMLTSYHAFAKSHPLISATFSTPTPDNRSYRATIERDAEKSRSDQAAWCLLRLMPGILCERGWPQERAAVAAARLRRTEDSNQSTEMRSPVTIPATSVMKLPEGS